MTFYPNLSATLKGYPSIIVHSIIFKFSDAFSLRGIIVEPPVIQWKTGVPW